MRLWVKRGVEGEWEDTGMQPTTPGRAFDFRDIEQDDLYIFFIQAKDNAGLLSPEASNELVFGGGGSP